MAAMAAPSHPFERRVAETQIPKSDVNNLIMDYLITEGYPSAAEKFAMEANIDRQPDHSFIEQRVQIRDSIHRGDLQQAIELINDLNPELLDGDNRLHFSLLRLQLVELIRASFTSTDTSAVAKAIEFAQQNLAPYATLDPQFKNDLERAMALLIVPKESWTQPTTTSSTSQTQSQPSTQTQTQSTSSTVAQISSSNFGALAELVDPSLRRKVAKDVNEAILQSQGERREANIRHLVRARAWAEQLARDKKMDLPERLGLGLDGDDSQTGGDDGGESNGGAAGTGAGDTTMADDNGNGSGNGGANATGEQGVRRSARRSAHGQADMLQRYTNVPSA